MKIVHIKVNQSCKDLFTHKTDHDSIGILFQEDDEHIYIKPFKRDVNQVSFIGSITRYPKNMISIENIMEQL